jgi:hypothetical protein
MKLDFVLVGSRKCGTTWVYYILKEHPNIINKKTK